MYKVTVQQQKLQNFSICSVLNKCKYKLKSGAHLGTATAGGRKAARADDRLVSTAAHPAIEKEIQ